MPGSTTSAWRERMGLPSGTALEILGEDEAAGYSQIRTSRGTEGWVRSQYLVTQPIAKLRLANAEAQLARARAELRSAQEKIRALSGDVSSQTSANAASRNRITQLESELTELKRVSGSAIELNSANLQLTETNTRLRDELDDVAEARARLESNERNQAILYGVGAILIGLLAGVLIKSRPQRSAWN
ncbi:MAG: TIGR04211 family SH3 domain-containing protein [Pseudomonadota bacterium]